MVDRTYQTRYLVIASNAEGEGERKNQIDIVNFTIALKTLNHTHLLLVSKCLDFISSITNRQSRPSVELFRLKVGYSVIFSIPPLPHLHRDRKDTTTHDTADI